MASITRFEDIEAWQDSRVLQKEFSRVSKRGGFDDIDLRCQMRRCANSAMANIAEGFDSDSNAEFIRFLKIAYRSLTEFQSHLYTCLDDGYVTPKEFDLLYDQARIAKSKTGGFIRYLKQHPRPCPDKLRKPTANSELSRYRPDT